MRFLDKTIIVTGGTSGLGAVTTRALVEEGAHVFFCGLDTQEGESFNNTLNGDDLQGKATFLPADVREPDQVKDFVDTVIGATGHIDGAVNNAAISHSAALFAEQPLDMVENVLRTNVMGIWHAMHYEIPHMVAAGGGSIVNVASILSKAGAAWMAAYGASKHAVIGLTKSAALDYLDQNIRINAVSPGPMQTPMFDRAMADIDGDMDKFAGGMPKAGPMDPKDVAKTILHLLSDEAKTVSGANMIVDGGASLG